ncbi:hypothetical protein, unlikely [Trypanosoma congolense IL3000]|uniref:Uncharacterized protein n=1 Tax=Trypanosoma congolense (strain IL3000) TaxID=1068625 RepID=F9WEW6_TRYCI|nr:hypothetical protein, unlikely [Trypanosoma congolense IL3000]
MTSRPMSNEAIWLDIYPRKRAICAQNIPPLPSGIRTHCLFAAIAIQHALAACRRYHFSAVPASPWAHCEPPLRHKAHQTLIAQVFSPIEGSRFGQTNTHQSLSRRCATHKLCRAVAWEGLALSRCH